MAGPFYFAWVDADEIVFDPVAHRVEDEDVVAFSVEQTEGEFAGLTAEIRNPRVGLLAPARKVWAWLSWDDGTDLVPLFFGRLVGVPNDIHREIVTLQFIARPSNFDYQKSSLAEMLKVAPYWDPVFVSADKRDDPDSVLEARSELWHVDRLTHVVTTSDLLVGEDGLEDFADSEVPYESVGITLKESPLRSVSVVGAVKWTQAHKSESDIAVYDNAVFPVLPTLGLLEAWPKTGSSLGGGWTVAHGSARSNVDNTESRTTNATGAETTFADGSKSSSSIGSTEPFPPPPGFRLLTAFRATSTPNSSSVSSSGFILATPTVYASLSLSYEASRPRTEYARFTLSTDVQALVTLAGEEEVPIISVVGTDVGLPLDDDGSTPPIGDVVRRSYFSTDRGLQSLEHLLLVGRAALVLRSRAVEVQFNCSFERAVELNLRKNARVHDFRIPGGEAVGKIVRYVIRADGRTGDLRGEVTVASAVGTGGAVAEVPGEPTYVEEGYVEFGYQHYDGRVVVVGTSDVGYTVPVDAPNDDGLTFPLADPFISGPSVSHVRVMPNGSEQEVGSILPPLGSVLGADVEAVVNAYANMVEARLDFVLPAVQGSKFSTAYDVEVTPLVIPAGINLGAL